MLSAIVLLIVGIVIAGGLGVENIDKSLTLTGKQKTKLTELNLDSYTVTDYEIGTDEIKRHLFKGGAINKEKTFKTYYMNCTDQSGEQDSCITWDKKYYTDCDRKAEQ